MIIIKPGARCTCADRSKSNSLDHCCCMLTHLIDRDGDRDNNNKMRQKEEEGTKRKKYNVSL
eukprot:COSAG01_NODE_9388_length_2460_cov_1.210504_2_plen_62_part_00